MRADETVLTDEHVVPNLHQVVDLRRVANARVTPAAAVYARACTYFHTIAEQHAQQRGENDDARNDAVARQSDSTTPPENAEAASAAGAVQAPLSEEEQAQEQWLRNIPDSSDTLLRNKFQYQYDQRRRQGELPEAENYAPY